MKRLRWVGLLAFLLSVLISHSAAQRFYVTSEPGQQLDLVDYTAGTVTNIFNIGSRPDSLIVNAQGQIFYTVTPLGTLRMFDPNTGQDTLLASLGSVFPRDLVFDPGGTSILVSLYGVGKLARYDMVSGTFTIFPSKAIGLTMDGLAYDPAGNLFAVVSRNTICQLDPATGAILQTVVLEPRSGLNGGDGMVYDTFTKNIWMTRVSTLGSGLIEIPLTETTPPVLGSPIFFQTGLIATPDGVISDGQGNLYIGEALQQLTQYSIPTDTVVKRLLSPGIDDLGFVPGPAATGGQFNVSLAPATITTLDNQSVNYTLSITTTNNYAPTFQITCTGLPSPAVCTPPPSALVGNSQIQVQTQSLPVGSYNFTVSVTDGITTHLSTGQVVIGNFAAALSSTSLSIGVGQSGTVGVSVSTNNGFSDPVTLSCSTPAGTTCSLSPASVTASASGTPSTLTISVQSRPSSISAARASASLANFLTGMSLAVGVLILPIGSKSRVKLKLGGLVVLCIIFSVSCGSSSTPQATHTGGSTPTTFTVSVQATAGTVVQNAGTVTVTVP